MLALIIQACLLADPAVCKEHQIPVPAASDPTVCAMYAPPHAAKWAGDHPQWAIKRWRCGALTQAAQ